MDLDVKTPEATMPEDQPKPAEASISINTAIEKKEDLPVQPDAASSAIESSAANEASVPSAAVKESNINTPKPPSETPAAPKVDASQPVPPVNIMNLKEDGTDTAKKVAAESEADRQKREEEKARIAQSNTFNPTMPSTDAIKGQSMAEVVSGLDQANSTGATSEASGTAVQPQAPAAENQVSQAEPQKKPGFFGRLFGKK